MLVLHAQQHLELRHRAGRQVEDRLRDVREALLVDRHADALGPRDPAAHPRLGLVAADVQRELVAAGLLGVVHRQVGVDEHVLAAQVVGRLEHRDADARGHRPVARARYRDPFGAQRLEQVLGHALALCAVARGSSDGELVAAEAGEDVALAQALAEQRRDPRDDLVAGGVAERVVDVLEVVEVEQQQRAVGAVAAHELGVLVELLGEARAVVQAGERVVRGEVVQVLLVVAAVRDVLHLDEEAARRPAVVRDRRGLQRDPDRRAAGVQEARLDLVLGALARQQRADLVAVVTGVDRVRQRVEAHAGELLGAAPREIRQRGVDAHDAPVAVGHRHADRRAVEGAAEELLGRAQLDELALAGGDVADGAGHHRALVGLDRAQGDLDGELGAVLAQPVELEVAAHRPGRGLAQIPLDVVAMLGARALGDELGDPLADELGAAIAEQPLGLRVDERDVAVTVDDHHRVGGGLQQRAELALRAPQQAVAAHEAADEDVVEAARPVQQPAQEFADRDHRERSRSRPARAALVAAAAASRWARATPAPARTSGRGCACGSGETAGRR